MKFRTRIGAALVGSGLVLSGLALAAPAASAAVLPGVHTYTVPIGGPQGFNPPGLSLDALDWAGTGSSSTCTTGAANVNALVGFWRAGATHAGCAADFTQIAVTNTTVVTALPSGAQGPFMLEYTPNGHESGLCVSTVTDVQGAFARLRTCALPTVANQWQDLALIPHGDGLNQIEAYTEPSPGPFFLNDKGFGGNGSPAISWVSTTGENQLFDVSS